MENVVDEENPVSDNMDITLHEVWLSGYCATEVAGER